MEFPPLIEGQLVRRYKRFLADVELPGGEVVVAHCPNPGSMKTMKEPGSAVWLSKSENPKRKLAYTWELVFSETALTLVHTGRANDIVDEGLRQGVVTELAGFDELHREVKVGEKSRLDFQLHWHSLRPSQSVFVEVKNVTMADGLGRATFPDSVTARGTKHLLELMALVAKGQQATLLFCCSRAGTQSIRPADEIDPLYGQTLREAAKAGVQILAYACSVSTQEGVALTRRIPVDLSI